MDEKVSGYDVVEPTEESILFCARIVHTAIEAMNSAHNEQTLSWEQSRDSVIAGIGRVLGNPHETYEQNHEAWRRFRESEGWIYGPIKDPEAKTHPCMVPYGVLSQYQRSKDAVFLAIVREFFKLPPDLA